MTHKDEFSSYTYSEGRTAIGQAIEFTCRPDAVGAVKEFLASTVRTISTPQTGRVTIPHGAYGKYTRYKIKQHDYAGGGAGYIEVLEIQNAPDGRRGIVINEYTRDGGTTFTEWETLESARSAFKAWWGSEKTNEEFPKLAGFKRLVACHGLTPWFYAIGTEQLVGDYAFPDGLQDDAVYRFGQQFVVLDHDNNPTVKKCMGTRLLTRRSEYYPNKESQYRIVHWDDGSIWDEFRGGIAPRPLEAGEVWITEAMQSVRALLAGKKTHFSINFADGTAFSGRLTKKKSRTPCAQGDYFVSVMLKGDKTAREGWVYDFIPTAETPDIVSSITQSFAKNGKEVERIEIKKSKVTNNGKKWSGVFFRPPLQS